MDFFFQLNLLPPYSLRSQGDKIVVELPREINSFKYEMEQLMDMWVEWIDPGNKGSLEYMKGMLLLVKYIFTIKIM